MFSLSSSVALGGGGVRSLCQMQDAWICGTQNGALYAINGDSVAEVPTAQHPRAVTDLCALSSSLLATACHDGNVRLYNCTDHALELRETLTGHAGAVTSLSACSIDATTCLFVSGSWDGTARIWKMDASGSSVCIATLPNHENSVSAAIVQATPLTIATASTGVNTGTGPISGQALRLWSVDVSTHQFQQLHHVADHEGPLRDVLCAYDQLVTCSNDGTLRLRNISTGRTESILSTHHTPMWLSLCALGPTLVAAGAEDGSVTIWTHGETQELRHGTTVWKVRASSNGDLVTACDDGMVRVFTTDEARFAPEAERQAFEQLSQQTNSNGPTPDEIARLPHWDERVTVPGTSEGQVHLFQRNSQAIAAQWTAGSWTEVGQVTGKPANQQAEINGVSYDHVLPIEIDQVDGTVARLQLGVNQGDDARTAALRFLDDNPMVPRHHVEEIARHVSSQVGHLLQAQKASTGMPLVNYQHLPSNSTLIFDTPLDKRAALLHKIASKLPDSPPASVSQVLQALETATTTISSSVVPDMVTALQEYGFCILDLARLAVLQCDNQAAWQPLLEAALSLPRDHLEGHATVAIPMLTLRLACNGNFCMPQVVSYAHACVASTNKNVRLSVATVIYNVCHAQPDVLAVLDVAKDVLAARTYEGEAIRRVLVGVGTLCLKSVTAKAHAQGLHLHTLVEFAASPFDAVTKQTAKEVYAALQ